MMITVITVVYNAVQAIEDTILSVIAQQHRNIEYIIIDGGSTDGTIEIIKQYQNKIKYWISENDKGIYDAMNKGWNIANENSYILYLGAGDRIIQLPDILDNTQSCIYFGDAILGEHKVFKAYANFRLKFGNFVHHQSLLIPKRLCPNPPFNIQYKVYADFDVNQRLLKRNVRFIKSEQLKSYVLPNGFSYHYKTFEWFYIIKNNYGLAYALLGYMYHQIQYIKGKLLNGKVS